MLWIIILVVSTLAAIVAWYLDTFTRYSPTFTAFAAGVVAFLSLLIVLVLAISVPQKINVFQRQKAYLAEHVVSDPMENAALTTKKLELNDWLYKSQFAATNYRVWTFYPDEILALTPIE